jgi:predicted GTPase
LNVELIDTAGLDRKLCGNDLDLAAQKKTIEIIQAADMILLVMDIGETMQRENLAIEQMIVDSDSEALLVKIYNKIDIYPPELTNAFNEYPAICAASPEGVQRAAQAIIDACGVGSITSSSTICFTDRQKRLMEKIIDNDSEEAIREHLELLRSGSLSAR